MENEQNEARAAKMAVETPIPQGKRITNEAKAARMAVDDGEL